MGYDALKEKLRGVAFTTPTPFSEDNFISGANNVPAVKYGMEFAGLYGGPVREPLVELSDVDKERAEQYYEKIQTAVVEPATTN